MRQFSLPSCNPSSSPFMRTPDQAKSLAVRASPGLSSRLLHTFPGWSRRGNGRNQPNHHHRQHTRCTLPPLNPAFDASLWPTLNSCNRNISIGRSCSHPTLADARRHMSPPHPCQSPKLIATWRNPSRCKQQLQLPFRGTDLSLHEIFLLIRPKRAYGLSLNRHYPVDPTPFNTSIMLRTAIGCVFPCS